QHVERRARLADADARLQPREAEPAAIAAFAQRVLEAYAALGRCWNPQFGDEAEDRADERCRRDADHAKSLTVHQQTLADRVGAAAEHSFPETVAEHDNGVAARHVVFARRERASDRRRDAERLE